MVHHSAWFHRVIMHAAENELLLRMWESLHVEIHSRKTLLQPNIDMLAVAESHAPILAAIDGRRHERACRLSREHQAIFRAQGVRHSRSIRLTNDVALLRISRVGFAARLLGRHASACFFRLIRQR